MAGSLRRVSGFLPVCFLLVMFCPVDRVFAGEADVVAVEARQGSDGSWRFDVTLRHGDEGWDHYADRWDIVGPDGTVYGNRVLAHPHVNEQPFTRSLSGVVIPDNLVSVVVRGHDLVHGLGGKELQVDLPR
ncbi:MAG: hypothetical protein P1V21_25355 [Rhizobiaceae bacterium]|nr:hypothetical protein [Rhizobiaceae bacterium]